MLRQIVLLGADEGELSGEDTETLADPEVRDESAAQWSVRSCY